MTDAERIAEYLNRCGLSDRNWPDCERILMYAGDDFTDESCYGVVKHLAAMLSDVRREERERIASALLEHAHHIKDSCDVCAIVNDIRAGAYDT